MNNHSNPKKSLGQHFLYDQNIINKIISAADIDQSDNILEIGSGRGHLTEALMNTGAQIISLEIDDDLYNYDLQRFNDATNVQILHLDAIDFDSADFFNKPFKLIANLPYNVASRLLRKFLFSDPHILFYCSVCVRQEASKIFDYSHRPILTYYGTCFWNDLSHNFIL